MEEYNYEQELTIDETALDIEWLEQPRIFMKYARAYANALKKVDKMKEKLEVVKAELSKKIRANPKEYDLDKVTETAVSLQVHLLPEYQEVYNEYVEAKYEAEMLKQAVKAFEQRKEALENLVRLHGQQYFSSPTVPRDLHEEVQKRKQMSNDIVRNKMRRKK